jgi:(2Fe-2S) ferredoxin
MAEIIHPELSAVAQSLGLEQFRHHIFLCVASEESKCCPKTASLASWEYLKKRLKELNLVGPVPLVFRTRADCLRVCINGPISVIYPECVWYHSCSPVVLEQIIQTHLIGGAILTEYSFAKNPSFISKQKTDCSV